MAAIPSNESVRPEIRNIRIITNMAFWQSRTWTIAADSLYDTSIQTDPDFLPWWREAPILWQRAKNYDVVVTMGVRESMAYGLLCALTGRRSKQVMCEVFIDAPSPSPAWRLKNALYRFVASRATGLLTNSSAEVEAVAHRYKLDRARIRYVPLNTNIADPRMETTDDGYVLSAGRTLRDYPTLLEAAHRIPEIPILVICGSGDFHSMEIPPSVKILREVSRDLYLDHLRRCRLVALPLLNTERATGQVVMLEAMAMGKPVITTRSPGTMDTIKHEENGFLIKPGDPDTLAQQIERLWNDELLRKRVGSTAVQTMRESASAERHAALKLAAINELSAADRS